MRNVILVPLMAAALATPVAAEVISATPAGFEVGAKATVRATPAEVYAALGRIGSWWNSEHTYSGDAGNMTLDPKAGGCFCEMIPEDGGSIEHARVVYARPGQALRLQGALGPLQAEAAMGTLTWNLKPVQGGTEISQDYVVGGYVRGGAEALAPIVDTVLAQQLDGLVRFLVDEDRRTDD